MRVNLFYLSPNPYGGWVTFTAHLMRALRAAGADPRLFKVGNKTENKERPYGYGETYRNLSAEDAKLKSGPNIVVAAAKNFAPVTEALLARGAYLVLHDPTELKNLPADLPQRRVVVIRRAGLEIAPSANFIRHPYQRAKPSRPVTRERMVSVSRIDFDKRTHILLDANRLLAPQRITIRGFENRIYTRFKVVPHYPEWVQSVAQYPRDATAAVELLAGAALMADMSQIKGDGGGTQYTFLEAWDAGCVPVLHEDWTAGRPQDDMQPGLNCMTVSSAEELAQLYRHADPTLEEAMVQRGYEQLEQHDPKLIGDQYLSLLNPV